MGTVSKTRRRMEEKDLSEIVHKIGCTRTIKTAIFVCAYLQDRHCVYPWADTIRYLFTDATDRNGFWTADIVVTSYNTDARIDKEITEMVNECRAFVAGAGEIWA